MDGITHSQDLIVTAVVIMTFFAAGDDLHRRRIANALLLFFLLPGLVYGGAISGWSWLLTSVSWGFFVLLALFPFFLFRAVGAGDIKLYATIAMLIGPQMTGWIFVYSLYAGGLIGLAIIVFDWLRRGTWRSPTVVYATSDIGQPTTFNDGFKVQGHLYLPFAVPIFLGTLTESIGSGHLDYLAEWMSLAS